MELIWDTMAKALYTFPGMKFPSALERAKSLVNCGLSLSLLDYSFIIVLNTADESFNNVSG